MKKLILLKLIFIMLLPAAIFTSCEENIPRNRPILERNIDSESTGTETEEEEEALRKDGAIIIQPGHCACSAGKSISLGNCDAVCSAKSSTADETPKLFFDTTVNTSISGSILEDIEGFCSTQEGELGGNASCSIEVLREDGSQLPALTFDPNPGQTSFEVDISGLNTTLNETLRLSIVENLSGARSTTIQLRLVEDIQGDQIGGPLGLMPVTEYACLFRTDLAFDDNSGELIINDQNRFHFYFIPETRPEPLLPTTIRTIQCHDIQTYGTTPINSPLFEENPQSFTVWNKSDPRFFDLDGDGALQVHNIIANNMALDGSPLASPPELFFPLAWPSGFDDGDISAESDATNEDPSQIANDLGYYMTPFLDDQTFKAYCPTREHFFSTDPRFRAMREIVGIDTEAIYAAKANNVCDFILIRESQVEDIWFYIEGGQHIRPTENTIAGKQIQFYWPKDNDPNSSPFVKKSNQRVYTILGAEGLNTNSCNSGNSAAATGSAGANNVRTNLPPHDNRLGCIPVLQNP